MSGKRFEEMIRTTYLKGIIHGSIFTGVIAIMIALMLKGVE